MRTQPSSVPSLLGSVDNHHHPADLWTTISSAPVALHPLRYRGRVMAEPEDDFSGMGSAPRGPSFLPSMPAAEPVPPPSAGPSNHPGPPRPPRSLRPTVISVLIIALVAAVVAGASLFAYWGDTHVSAPARTPVAPLYSSPPNRIDFDTAEGSGQLIMRARSWVSDGAVPPLYGNYLRVEVELVCTAGEVDYDPYLFQAFDQSGQLFEMAAAGTGGRVLAVGTLAPGERIRGTIAFDMPRGEVTLLLSDDSDNTVTALRVPD